VSSPLATSRRSWHGVAELLLAGPQYRQSQTIRLRITPGGFATVQEPDLRVEGTTLVIEGERVAMPGHTCAGLSVLTGAPAGSPPDLYKDGSGVDPEEALHFDDQAIAALASAFELGDAALRAFASDQTPVLWPEHFDVGISVNEVNYGVSPGDGFLGEPYAYVGPWQRREGEFWNAPFGAVRPIRELSDVDAVVAFLTEGRDRAAVV
jgi:hypothetical protein